MNEPAQQNTQQKPSLAELKRTLDKAVRDYETAICRKPADEEEIRRCVNRCAVAREKFNSSLEGGAK